MTREPVRGDNLGSPFLMPLALGEKCFCGKNWSDPAKCGDPDLDLIVGGWKEEEE